MESGHFEEPSKIPDAVIARGKKESEIKETLDILDEIAGQAENTQGDLKESVVLLRTTLSKMYENFLAEVRDGDEHGAITSLGTTNQKAENVKRLAIGMETLMDDFRRKVDELKGQVRN